MAFSQKDQFPGTFMLPNILEKYQIRVGMSQALNLPLLTIRKDHKELNHSMPISKDCIQDENPFATTRSSYHSIICRIQHSQSH